MTAIITEDIKDQLFSAAFAKEEGREDFLTVLRTIPLNKANFEVVFDNATSQISRQWVLEWWGPELMHILSHSNGWDDWVMDFPLIDELILSVSSDPRWLEVLSFRWTMSDGRPEDGPRETLRTPNERQEFFSECWKATISEDNTKRLEQMLGHPQWNKHLNEDIIQMAIWRPLKVWRVFHDNNQPLPLRMFWRGMMVGIQSPDNQEKLQFLITEAGSTPHFIVQQYAHGWSRPLPEHLALLIENIANTISVDLTTIEKLHYEIAQQLLRNDNGLIGKHSANEVASLLADTPLFDGVHLINAFVQHTKTPLDAHQSAVVEAVLQTLTADRYEKIVEQYIDHPTFADVPSMQHTRIGRTLTTADHAARLKKI